MTHTHIHSLSINNSKAKSQLNIEGAMIEITSTLPYPNCWKRFWYKFLLGWEWKDLTIDETLKSSLRHIKELGMAHFLNDQGEMLLKNLYLLPILQKKYPKQKDKLELWRKLHGVQL